MVYYSEKITDIINLITQSGWNYYDAENKIHYLPLGDRDDYDWQTGFLEQLELQKVIEEKQEKNGQIGFDLYHDNSDVGISILARNTKEIQINLDINRKTIEAHRDDITDVSWYIANILQRMIKKGCPITSIEFEEYEG
ncbi:MAG: hypothetical protein E7294_00760 [Lachnospiraceae bacterium]|nr:hypothetical protein [Lachnospiraceae bacterium]